MHTPTAGAAAAAACILRPNRASNLLTPAISGAAVGSGHEAGWMYIWK
jgi:hypothetical protein